MTTRIERSLPLLPRETPQSTISSRLLSLIKAVTQIASYALLQVIGLFTCFALPCLNTYTQEQKAAGLKAWEEFRGVVQPPPLVATPPLVPQELTAQDREWRWRAGDENIAQRLQREGNAAQNQMTREANKRFAYVEAPNENGLDLQSGQMDRFQIGIASHQGLRNHMEDQHLFRTFHFQNATQALPVPLSVQVFAVFDGHGGAGAALYAKDHLIDRLQQTLREFNSTNLTDVGIWNALKMTFVRLNQQFKQEQPQDMSGSTATVAIVLNNQIWTANVGDSRAVLDNNGIPLQLTEDAKPADPRYQRGINHRNGLVWANRINGVLGVARALGNQAVQGISARPKITKTALNPLPGHSHLILASDGFWDVTASRQAVQAAHQVSPIRPRELAKNLVYSALQAGTTDNTTVMVIKL